MRMLQYYLYIQLAFVLEQLYFFFFFIRFLLVTIQFNLLLFCFPKLGNSIKRIHSRILLTIKLDIVVQSNLDTRHFTTLNHRLPFISDHHQPVVSTSSIMQSDPTWPDWSKDSIYLPPFFFFLQDSFPIILLQSNQRY